MRVMVAGATGIVGREVVGLLEERSFPVDELKLLATDRSMGAAFEFCDASISVESELPDLRGLDLIFLCTPSAASLEIARQALRVETPCIDLSRAFAGTPEVPLLCPDLPLSPNALEQPVLRLPSATTLAWSLALLPLRENAGLVRVMGTCLQSASRGGREGVESLSRETIALLAQRELPDPTVFDRTVAFDCVPHAAVEEDESGLEETLAEDLCRLLGEEFRLVASAAQVPTFVGEASFLAVETRELLDWSRASSFFMKAPGLELWDTDPRGPSTRSATGRDAVILARLRRDPSHDRGVLLWLFADPPRLVASHAVRLAEARFATS